PLASDLRLRPHPRLRVRLRAPRTRRRNRPPGRLPAALLQPRRRDGPDRHRRSHPAPRLETAPTTALRLSLRSCLLHTRRPGRRLLAARTQDTEIKSPRQKMEEKKIKNDREKNGERKMKNRIWCSSFFSLHFSLCRSLFFSPPFFCLVFFARNRLLP